MDSKPINIKPFNQTRKVNKGWKWKWQVNKFVENISKTIKWTVNRWWRKRALAVISTGYCMEVLNYYTVHLKSALHCMLTKKNLNKDFKK